MKCPRCGLHSQDIAERCDCGYDFKTGKLEASSLVADADTLLEQSGKSTMRYGAILFLVGAGMTALMSLTVAGESQIRSIGSRAIGLTKELLRERRCRLRLPEVAPSPMKGVLRNKSMRRS